MFYSEILDTTSFFCIADKPPVSKIPSDLPQWKQELLRKKEKEKMVSINLKICILSWLNEGQTIVSQIKITIVLLRLIAY